MTLCPIALAVGCRKCPIFSFCPVKTIIGDQPSAAESSREEPAARAAARPTGGKKSRGRRKGR